MVTVKPAFVVGIRLPYFMYIYLHVHSCTKSFHPGIMYEITYVSLLQERPEQRRSQKKIAEAIVKLVHGGKVTIDFCDI